MTKVRFSRLKGKIIERVETNNLNDYIIFHCSSGVVLGMCMYDKSEINFKKGVAPVVYDAQLSEMLGNKVSSIRYATIDDIDGVDNILFERLCFVTLNFADGRSVALNWFYSFIIPLDYKVSLFELKSRDDIKEFKSKFKDC